MLMIHNIRCHKRTLVHTTTHAHNSAPTCEQDYCARPRDHAVWRAQSENGNSWVGEPRGLSKTASVS
eukprot:399680-Ditylum_brightwellii.AAC.1